MLPSTKRKLAQVDLEAADSICIEYNLINWFKFVKGTPHIVGFLFACKEIINLKCYTMLKHFINI